MIKKHFLTHAAKKKTHQSLMCQFDHNKKCKNFQNFCTFKTRLPDFHKMTLTLLKSSFPKQTSRILSYSKYEFFNHSLFRDRVLSKLSDLNLGIGNKCPKHSKKICFLVLNIIAPLRPNCELRCQVGLN